MQLFIPVLIGLVAGVLGGLLGIGGSLIIIPGMVIYLSHTAAGYQGIDQHLLQAAAMIVNVFVAAPSVIAHYRAGAIMRPIVVWLIPASIVGILSGVALSNSPAFARQNGAYLAMIFCGFLVYVIGYNLHRMRQLPRPVGDEAVPGIGVVQKVIKGNALQPGKEAFEAGRILQDIHAALLARNGLERTVIWSQVKLTWSPSARPLPGRN